MGIAAEGLFVQTTCSEHDIDHGIGIAIRGWSPVLEITTFVLINLSWNTDRTAPVSDTITELIDSCSFMRASQTPCVVHSFAGVISSNVFRLSLGELLDGGQNGSDASGIPHALGRKICVRTGAVPIAGHRLGIETDYNTEVFSETLQDVPGSKQEENSLSS